MLVQDGIYDEFRSRFLARAAEVTWGDSRDESVDLGPLVSRAPPTASTVSSSAPSPTGRGDPRRRAERRAQRGHGWLLPPSDRLRGVGPEQEITCQEVFGPVLTLQQFSTEDDGVAMANDTEVRLAATIVTGSQERAERVSSQVRAGTVWVNCFFVRDLSAPFGGSGRSGIGRGRDLVLRLLLRREEHGFRTERMELAMGEVVGAGLLAHVPTMMLRGTRRELNEKGDLAGPGSPPAAEGRVRDPSTTTPSWSWTPLVHHGRVRRHGPGPPGGPVHRRGAPRGMCRIPDWQR